MPCFSELLRPLHSQSNTNGTTSFTIITFTVDVEDARALFSRSPHRLTSYQSSKSNWTLYPHFFQRVRVGEEGLSNRFRYDGNKIAGSPRPFPDLLSSFSPSSTKMYTALHRQRGVCVYHTSYIGFKTRTTKTFYILHSRVLERYLIYTKLNK